jgi:Transcription factor Iwr1
VDHSNSWNRQEGEGRTGDQMTSTNNGTKSPHCSVVVWKRFESGDESLNKTSFAQRGAAPALSSSSSERFRIVNAMLAEETDEDNMNDEHGRRGKRRKLTVLDTSTATAGVTHGAAGGASSLDPLRSILASNPASAVSPRPQLRRPLKILDPLTRIVDDSLHDVLAGNRTVAEHHEMLRTDPRFTLQDVGLQRRWWTWSHSSGGNLLHCCALWNDSSVAHEVLQQVQHRHRHQPHRPGRGSASSAVNPSDSDSYGSSAMDVLGMMEAADGDGRTPYEVAQLSGHADVCQVLEAHGGDTTNYVYDIFLPDEDAPSIRPASAAGESKVDGIGSADNDNDHDDSPPPMLTAELSSGVGYWTPEGELILEADERCSRSLSYETDGDIDSNCEDYGGNDYPDGEEEDDEEEDRRGFGGDEVGNQSVGDDSDDRDDDRRFLHIHDEYDEYDWEQDLGEGEEHAYYDESHTCED